MGYKEISDNHGIRFRGTIPVGHALNEFCFDKPHNVAFKQILNLAEQALNTQAGLTRMLSGHPLAQVLSEVTPQEALTLLLGMTKVTQDREASQFRSASASEPEHPLLSTPIQTVTSHDQASGPGAASVIRVEPMDMGLDDLDSLNNFSVHS